MEGKASPFPGYCVLRVSFKARSHGLDFFPPLAVGEKGTLYITRKVVARVLRCFVIRRSCTLAAVVAARTGSIRCRDRPWMSKRGKGKCSYLRTLSSFLRVCVHISFPLVSGMYLNFQYFLRERLRGGSEPKEEKGMMVADGFPVAYYVRTTCSKMQIQ